MFPKKISYQIWVSCKIGSCDFVFWSLSSSTKRPDPEKKTTDITFQRWWAWSYTIRFELLESPDVSWLALVVVASPTKPKRNHFTKSIFHTRSHTQHNIPQCVGVFGALNDLCKNLEDACPGGHTGFGTKMMVRIFQAVRYVGVKDAGFYKYSNPLITTVLKQNNPP